MYRLSLLLGTEIELGDQEIRGEDYSMMLSIVELLSEAFINPINVWSKSVNGKFRDGIIKS